MFKIFKQVKELEEEVYHELTIQELKNRINALEDHLNVDYFNGPKYKPHYRKRKVVKGKVGRPRKNK